MEYGGQEAIITKSVWFAIRRHKFVTDKNF